MIKILFVCHGNICRSPMAEFVFKDMVKKAGLENDFFIDSAATSTEEIGNNIHRGTLRKLESVGIHGSSHIARQIAKSDFDNFDYIIGMEDYNVYNIKRFYGINDSENNKANKKIFKLLDLTDNKRNIDDPWYTGDFDTTYDDILKGLNALLEFVKSKNNS